MKRLALILLFFLLFANVAHARLGETLEELEKRFGKGKILLKMYIKPPHNAIYDFNKNGIRIRAYFIGDKCGMISYFISPKYFTAKERDQFLDINKENSKWIKTDKAKRFDGKSLTKPKESWKSSDGKMFAYNYTNNTMYIFTKEYLDKQKAHDDKVAKEKQEKEKKKLDGF